MREMFIGDNMQPLLMMRMVVVMSSADDGECMSGTRCDSTECCLWPLIRGREGRGTQITII